MDIKQILVKARANIEKEENWSKGIPYIEGDCMCAIGACMKAINPDINNSYDLNYDEFALVEVAEVTLNEASYNVAYRTMVAYNDAPKTTHQDVLKVFDKAIVDAA